MKNAWKFLGIALVLISAVAALWAPLKPGLVAFEPLHMTVGEQALQFRIYPALEETPDAQFYLKGAGDFFLPISGQFQDGVFKGNVTIPDTLSSAMLNLVGALPGQEIMHLQGATFVDSAQVIPGVGTAVPELKNDDPGAFRFPFKHILYQTIRNLNFHVPMWFAMMIIMLVSLIYSIRFLNKGEIRSDLFANEAAKVGLLFSFIGIATGAVWAKFTWGNWWVDDPKLNGAAVATLVYLAYFVLRGSIQDESKRGRLAAVYNVFAFVMMLVFIMVLPRLTDSLHPGNGGNPAFSQYDLDNQLRKVFYPAVLGWILVGMWIVQLAGRMKTVQYNRENED